MELVASNSFSSFFAADNFFTSDFTFGGEDPFAAVFSPIQDDKKMILEETPSTDTRSTGNEESHLESPLFIPDASEAQFDNRSKDGLKFCRKLTNLMLGMLNAPADLFNQIMTFSSQVLVNLLRPLSINGVSASQIKNIQHECLEIIWTEFKDLMSYKKNKKICIVKSEHWNMLFDKKEFSAQLKRVFKTLSKTLEAPETKLVLNDPIFCELFSQVLFYSNKLAVIVLIMKDNSDKGDFLRELKTIDNFVTMVLSPELMQFYNHRKGKFALECCEKCKICKSKLVPSDFLSVLGECRRKMEYTVSFINQIFLNYGSNSFETSLCLVEFGLTQL